jgi:hypothetical protein
VSNGFAEVQNEKCKMQNEATSNGWCRARVMGWIRSFLDIRGCMAAFRPCSRLSIVHGLSGAIRASAHLLILHFAFCILHFAFCILHLQSVPFASLAAARAAHPTGPRSALRDSALPARAPVALP